jgi:hypothetical protein
MDRLGRKYSGIPAAITMSVAFAASRCAFCSSRLPPACTPVLCAHAHASPLLRKDERADRSVTGQLGHAQTCVRLRVVASYRVGIGRGQRAELGPGAHPRVRTSAAVHTNHASPQHLPVVLARVNTNHAPIKLRSRTNALAHVRAPSTRRLV